MQKEKSINLRQLCVMAMLCALAFAAVALIRIPVVLFLKYEPKDVLLAIGGFLYGPAAGIGMSVVVALVELVTVSDTGLIGLLMNILSSALFVGISSAIYHRGKSIKRAVLALIIAALAVTAGMVLWNYLITPLYMQVTREQVAGMLLTVFLPFNLLKSALNATLTVLLYKHVVTGLRAARLLPPSDSGTGKKRHAPWVISLFVLVSLVLVLLAWKGII